MAICPVCGHCVPTRSRRKQQRRTGGKAGIKEQTLPCETAHCRDVRLSIVKPGLSVARTERQGRQRSCFCHVKAAKREARCSWYFERWYFRAQLRILRTDWLATFLVSLRISSETLPLGQESRHWKTRTKAICEGTFCFMSRCV